MLTRINDARLLIASYFGVTNDNERLPWNYERNGVEIDHVAPITLGDALKGYTKKSEYLSDRCVLSSGSTGMTINHMQILVAAKMMATRPELHDEIFF